MPELRKLLFIDNDEAFIKVIEKLSKSIGLDNLSTAFFSKDEKLEIPEGIEIILCTDLRPAGSHVEDFHWKSVYELIEPEQTFVLYSSLGPAIDVARKLGVAVVPREDPIKDLLVIMEQYCFLP